MFAESASWDASFMKMAIALLWSEAGNWSGVFFEGLCCRPRSTTAYALPEATWYKLPSDLQVADSCAGLGGIGETKL